MKKAAILTIGDEILIGQVVDTNSAWIGEQLHEIGIEISRTTTVSDTMEAILEGLRIVEEDVDFVFITGGLGPTKDDITKHALAEHFNSDLIFNSQMYESLEKFFEKLGRVPGESHRIQAYLPSNAKFFMNYKGTAPAMLFERDGKSYFSLPGVPYEMKHLFAKYLLPILSKSNNNFFRESITLNTIGSGEAKLEEAISDIVETFPPEVSIAYLPHLARVRLRITAKHKIQSTAEHLCRDFSDRIKERLGILCFGEGKITLAEVVGELLKEKNLMLSTAESCTGGAVGAAITSRSGASEYFEGGTIVYSNALKEKLLDVKESTLSRFGAVSEETAKEMVLGICKNLETDIGVAITGIAGPTGGTPQKPVGTVWVACGNATKIETRMLKLTAHRDLNIEASTDWALNMVRLFLLGS